MSRILISINPDHVKNIVSGIKKFEYRTRVAKQDIDSIIVYCTSPTKKVLAEVTIDGIIKGTPDELWKKTCDFSGITREFFDLYFNNRKIAYAYKLGKVVLFKEPKELLDFGIKSAPQSYVYINEKTYCLSF